MNRIQEKRPCHFLTIIWIYLKPIVSNNWRHFFGGIIFGSVVYLAARPTYIYLNHAADKGKILLHNDVAVSIIDIANIRSTLFIVTIALFVLLLPFLIRFTIRIIRSWFYGLFTGWLVIIAIYTVLALAHWHSVIITVIAIGLIIAPIAFRYLRSLTKIAPVSIPLVENNKTTFDLTIHSDNPIYSWADDQLQRSEFVRELAIRIIEQGAACYWYYWQVWSRKNICPQLIGNCTGQEN